MNMRFSLLLTAILATSALHLQVCFASEYLEISQPEMTGKVDVAAPESVLRNVHDENTPDDEAGGKNLFTSDPVTSVGGLAASLVASGARAGNAATNANAANTIVKRDSAGNFSANTIIANLAGNALTATQAGYAVTAGTATKTTSFSGGLSGDVTGTQNATVVSSVGGVPAEFIYSGVNAANDATNTNLANAIVKRDGKGNFSANTITANVTGMVTGSLKGNADTATTANYAKNAGIATRALGFNGSLRGDVTGTQSETVVASIGGAPAGLVASAVSAANAATNENVTNTIIKRDAKGNFSANTITANLSGMVTGSLKGNADTATTANYAKTAGVSGSTDYAKTAGSALTTGTFTDPLSGDVVGNQRATVVNFIGGASAADVASATRLVHEATSVGIPGMLVTLDNDSNFSANTITANIIGNLTGTADTAINADYAAVAGRVDNANYATNAGKADIAASFSDELNGDVTGIQSATRVNFVGGAPASDVASATKLVISAVPTGRPGSLVMLDGDGNFAANTITANVIGTLTGSLMGNAETATNAQYAVFADNVDKAEYAIAAGNADTATSFTAELIGDVVGTQTATVVRMVGSAVAADVASATKRVSAATSMGRSGALVMLDDDSNFVANTISANLVGNVTGSLTGNADTATNAEYAAIAGSAGSADYANATGSALTAGTFIEPLSGDVVGTQKATVVNFIGGTAAADVASAASLVSTATSVGTAGMLVMLDEDSNFVANTITANLIGNVTGSLIGNADTSTTAGYAETAGSAGSADYAIAAGSAGTADYALTVGIANTAIDFTGVLAGDVAGTQGDTVVHYIYGQTAQAIADAAMVVNQAISDNVPSTLILRDVNGGFGAGNITASSFTFDALQSQVTPSANLYLLAYDATSNSLVPLTISANDIAALLSK
jgi:hypothetical protein